MTPQTTFMVLAPIKPPREAELRRLLASMNDAPGRLNVNNALIPFGQFDTLHVARLLIMDDRTVEDARVYGLPPRMYPLYLTLLGDLDGDADSFLEELARRAPAGLRAVFSCCEGFSADTDVLAWMKAHSVRSSASYVNWRGRTVRRVREEAALREALEQHLRSNAPAFEGLPPPAVHARLRQLIDADIAAGRLTLSADGATPLRWWVGNLLHLIGVPLLLVLASPLLLVIAAIALVRLRRLEKTDPELCSPPDRAASAELALLEDYDVTNQFSAMGTLKPGMVRLWATMFALLAIDYGARHVFTRGRLARVRTIHFARWVFLDNKRRVVFLSTYDGSLESYMDDFINKVGFGLNLIFSNGIGYPRTNWLFLNGSADERKFKAYLRRHQVPTQVWYKAYPGVTAIDLERNGRIRQGLESSSMTDREAGEWAALL
jgi:hypothetical protein